MIEKILERLAEREDYLVEQFRGACDTEDLKWVSKIQEVENSKKIVQEVAKEYGKDTNVRSRCDTCTHNVADEVPPICYMCSKGIEDNYEPIEQKGE